MGSQNRVTSIHETPNEDGNNVVGIELGDGSTFDAVIDLPVAQLFSNGDWFSGHTDQRQTLPFRASTFQILG